MRRDRRYRKTAVAATAVFAGTLVASAGVAVAGRAASSARPECRALLGADERPLAGALKIANDRPGTNTIELTAGCRYTVDLPLVVSKAGGPLRIVGNRAVLTGERSSLAVEEGADLVVDEMTFVGGGSSAIVSLGNVEVRNSIFSRNSSGDGDGGAIDSFGGSLIVSDSTFTRNETLRDDGGAIYSGGPDGAFLEVSRSTFSGNRTADGDGGAIYSDGTVRVSESTFSGNVAGRGDGGAIFGFGVVDVTNSTFHDNAADGDGGAVYDDGSLEVASVTFSRNSAGRAGGAILSEGRASVESSMFVGNAAGFGYGGALASFGPTTLARSAVAAGGADACFGRAIGGRGNLTGPGAAGCGSGRAVSGLDEVGDLADNGGPTATVALDPGNPAIDGGTAGGCPEQDQRGRPRVRTASDPCDVGAWEASGSKREPRVVQRDDETSRNEKGKDGGDGPDDKPYSGEGSTEETIATPAPASPGAGGIATTTAPVTTPPPGAVPPPTGEPPGPASSASPVTPVPDGADLSLEDVRLEIVPEGEALGFGGPAVVAASGDALRLTAEVVNNSAVASEASSIFVSRGAWMGEEIRVAAVPADSSVDVDETISAPPRDDETKFTVTIVSAFDADPSNNARPDVVALASSGGGFPTKTVIIVAAVVLLGVVGAIAVSGALGSSAAAPTPASGNGQEPRTAGATGNGLDDHADRYLGGDPSPPLWEASALGDRLRDELGDDQRISPLIATAYWQAVVGTKAFRRTLEATGASAFAVARPDALVVAHAGGTRFDLVVLDPESSLSEPSSTTIDGAQEDLRETWERMHERGDLGPAWRELPARMVAKVLHDIAHNVRFGVVVAPKPDVVLTGCPSPAWAVGAPGQPATSTAGATVVDGQGRSGVTVADHAVRGFEKVVVDGHVGTVVSSDAISDSSFVEVAVEVDGLARGHKGPLSGVSPRQMEIAEFDGSRSGRRSARVTGWDPTILTTESYIQSKIVTEPVTMPGDSGAALVDREDNILGFAFYTTGLNAEPAHSGWIWAESVYRFHGLRHPATD